MIQPEPSSRHPLVIFLLLLCLTAGTGMILSPAPRPDSLESQLPTQQVVMWAWLLTLGALSTLIGLALQPKRMRDGVLLEWVGMSALSPAAIIYAGAAIAQVGWSATLPSGSIFGLGLACAWRWWTLRRDIKKSKDLMKRALTA